ncbi:MAG: 2-amino-4-hydroxy-6-hydroxymethyldihydropteridine diphosphokinase [Winogradskyella sp.]|uniref:2-amino-4-hydroxy-6- hydroxymethyldihydropteridine diphosphokinase n=1 Tax=Winogradskyella sp. TaxID=1883156 RepID=UPI0017DAE9EE|nr:2-amino-4-hydroxy-6-hydroxymethyldihydropteridine diphosphokinase [Winogradskyella sp.]MBT8245035.1 2-amino-4-hydroxy-6-hydroxymethyldihydropteridine diphosphokinase [Winogradskyella sp.]NNK22123.1 2-amino-4-hydroxy-6-hydroxymethyldihydropteridine diphosphokinase [Winogradskyella sp.]
MKPPKRVYIALGSNKGNKLQYLQLAVDTIFKNIGAIKKLSNVYKTSAVGFDGDDFYNACIVVETELKPRKLLKILQDIEKQLGRTKKSENGYQSREIDLDILLFEDEVINEKNLIVPHPQIQNRKFVLQPLLNIVKDFKHPILDKTIEELFEVCEDGSEIESINIWLKNPRKSYTFGNYNYIAIEGNIGAGKTSLANKISNDFNAKLILERFADNPFLPKFYKEPERYAFTLEMSFLADRYQQISDDLSQLDLFKDFMVSDYDVNKSLIFSKVTLPEDEFRLYLKLFYQVYKDIAKPDLYVYLYQNTERLQANIKQRGRKYESDIKDEYLEKLNSRYLEFLKSQTDLNVKIIDISDRDFVKNREDYLWILNQLN